jgi:hypothetical protein
MGHQKNITFKYDPGRKKKKYQTDYYKTSCIVFYCIYSLA